MQQIANDAGGVFLGGKYPMIMNYAPGGCTQLPGLEDIITYKQRMETVQGFVDTVVVPDLLAIAPYYIDLASVGKGVGNFLSWGVLDEKSQDPYDRVFPRGGIFGGVLKPQQVDPNETKMYTKHSFYPGLAGRRQAPARRGPGATAVRRPGPHRGRASSRTPSTTGPRPSATAPRRRRWRSARSPRC